MYHYIKHIQAMNKNVFIAGLMILLPFFAGAQNFEDALRYSSVRIEGTARSGAMGNAFGALGSDFTGVGINPAGLGIYRSSEFALTPSFGMTEISSGYLGNNMVENDYRPALGNLSYVAVMNSRKSSQSGVVSVNLGIGFNRLKDFNSYSIAEAFNTTSSFLDHMSANANNNKWSEYYEELAWDTYTLDKTDGGVYFSDLETARGGTAYNGHRQRKSYDRGGAMDEYTFGLGLNFNHRFYLGASLGITDFYYRENSTLKEWDEEGTIPYLNDFEFNSSLRTYGTGYNFKLGAIFKPVNNLRIGASLVTPTLMKLNDRFETTMGSSITWDDNSSETFSASSPYNEYDYELTTPFRATLSGALVMGKRGLVSADVEYIDYAMAKLRSGGDGYNFADENSDITDLFQPVTNVRLGGEFRLTESFSLRGGYELYPSAFKNMAFGVDQPNAGQNHTVLSAGFGYSSGGFFADMAFRHGEITRYNRLYPEPSSDGFPTPAMAAFDEVSNKVLFTLGFRF